MSLLFTAVSMGMEHSRCSINLLNDKMEMHQSSRQNHSLLPLRLTISYDSLWLYPLAPSCLLGTPIHVAQNGCPSLKLCHLSAPAPPANTYQSPNSKCPGKRSCFGSGEGSAPVHLVMAGKPTCMEKAFSEKRSLGRPTSPKNF